MEIKTQTVVRPGELPGARIGLRTSILTVGSCFADNMAEVLTARGFDIVGNPYGQLFNPVSCSQALEHSLEEGYDASARCLLTAQGWRSYDHSSAFGGETRAALLTKISRVHGMVRQELPRIEWLFLTLGSADVYELADGYVVSNCHKQPSGLFTRRMLSVEEIVSALTQLLEQVFSIGRAGLRVMLTVSPVRHTLGDLHRHELSKSRLLLACEALAEAFGPRIYYFPAYEIVMDELRDYRYYAEDMAHPSRLAVQIIAERLLETCMETGEKETWAKVLELRRELAHRQLDSSPTGRARRLDYLEGPTSTALEALRPKLSTRAFGRLALELAAAKGALR